MDTTDLIALISLIVSIISTIGLFYQHSQALSDFVYINPSRRKSLRGNWIGSFVQDNKIDGNSLTGEIRLTLQVGRKKIKGVAIVNQHYFKNSVTLLLTGGYRDERFVSLSYKNQKKSVIQFGHMLLELIPNGKKLKGRVLGFGHESEQIVIAELNLQRD